MKLAIVADLHFNGKDFKYQLIGFREILETCQENEVSWIIVAGDFFDKPVIGDKYVSTEKMLLELTSIIEEFGIPFIILEGNHDWTGTKTDVRPLSLFKGNNLVCPILGPTVLKLDGVDLILFPWPWLVGVSPIESKKYWEDYLVALNNIKTPGVKKLFIGHLQLDNVINSYGITLPDTLTTISLDKLMQSGCDNYFLGHIHNRQTFYIGAPWHLNHGESFNECGFVIYDCTDGYYDFIELERGTRYETVTLEEYEAPKFRRPLGVRVRVEGERSPIRLQPGDTYTKIKTKSEQQARVEILDTSDVKELFKLWATSKNIDYSKVIDLIPDNMGMDTHFSKNDLLYIKEIHLKNVGPHTELKFEFPGFGRYGVFGGVGSGKSIFLESTLASLYNVFLHRGNVKNLCNKDYSLIKVNFVNSSGEYIWERRCKNGVWSATVTKIVDGVSEIITTAAASIEQATKLAETVVGLKQTLLWSCFSAQTGFKDKDGSRDMIAADPSKRMDFLRSFLGLEVYDDLYTEFNIKLVEHEKTLKRFEEYNFLYKDMKAKLKVIESRLEELDNTIFSKESDYQNLTADLKDITAKDNKKLLDLNLELKDLKTEKSNLMETYNKKRALLEQEHSRYTKEYNLAVEARDSLKSIPCFGLGELGGCLDCKLIKNTERVAASETSLKNSLLSIKEKILTLDRKDEFVTKINELNASILEKEHEIAKFNDSTRATDVDVKINILKGELSKLTLEKGEYIGKVKLVKENILKLESFINENSNIKEIVENYRVLCTAFSREGITQLLIDQHVKEIQLILDDICEKDFDNIFNIELTTLGTRKNKDIQYETFLINCNKNGLVYPAEHCSGGELAAIKVAFRVALILYQAQRNLGNLRVAFLDEPTAHQDGFFSQCTLKMLERLKDYFNQVIVVSHDHTMMNLYNYTLVLE